MSVKKKKLKTITLGAGGDPIYTIFPGIITPKQFNKAFRNEGWDSDDVDVEYEFWVKTGKRSWREADPRKDKKAIACTVSAW